MSKALIESSDVLEAVQGIIRLSESFETTDVVRMAACKTAGDFYSQKITAESLTTQLVKILNDAR